MDREGTQPELESKAQSSYKVEAYLGKSFPKQYENLIYSKWMRSLRKGNDYFKLIDSASYYKTYQHYLGYVLNRDFTIVRLAILSEDSDVVLGFSVSEKNILHYCYTNVDMRKQKIALSLVPFEVQTITHLTKTGMTIWNKKFPNAIFNPFA